MLSTIQIKHIHDTLQNSKKGDISITELRNILKKVMNGNINDMIIKIYNMIINLIDDITVFYRGELFEHFFKDEIYTQANVYILNHIIDSGYIINSKELKYLYYYLYNNVNTALNIIYKIKLLNPSLKINWDKIIINFNVYFLNKNYTNFKNSYIFLKLDYNKFYMKCYYKITDDDINEIFNNLMDFFEYFKIKFNIQFLIKIITLNIDLIENKLFYNCLKKLTKYYDNQICKINNSSEIFTQLYDVNEDILFWQLLIEEYKVNFEKFNFTTFDNKYIYNEMCKIVIFDNYKSYFNITQFIKIFFDGNIDDKFIKLLRRMSEKYDYNQEITAYTAIINDIDGSLINNDNFKYCFRLNSGISKYLENKLVLTDDFIIENHNNYLEKNLIECTKYNQYCSSNPNVIDHLILNFFSTDTNFYKCKINIEILKNKNKDRYRSTRKTNIYDKSYIDKLCKRIQNVTILVNDDDEFKKYKEQIKNKVELYIKIINFSTYDMIDFIKNNDITDDIILVMSIDDTIKNLQMCMGAYLKKLKKSNL
jgi:hypothetical protein